MNLRRHFGFLILLFLFNTSRAIVPQAIVARSSLTYSPPSQISVWMYWLTPDGARRIPYTLCASGHTTWGCTAFCDESGYPCDWSQTIAYPYTTNPATVSIETDYLLDVLPQEMGTYYHPTALQAQAIAARTYAYWHINQGSAINNSTEFQVFIPYKFESLYPATFPDNTGNPCASSNLNTDQRIVCNAVASQYYISYGTSPNDDLPAFTEFFADAWGQTASGSQPYLLGVEDPISTGCDADDDGHGRGMSQEGASRWARGNRCSHTGAGDDRWSVRWGHAEQILTHYYTGIHIRDRDGNRLTPEYRWVPLEVNWHTPDNRVPIMYHDRSYEVTFRVQNSGTITWPGTGQVYLWYHGWEQTKRGGEVRSLAALEPGGVREETVILYPPVAPHPGTPYRLRFEMFLEVDDEGIGFSEIERGRPWYTYDVVVCVDGPCATYLPLVTAQPLIPDRRIR